MTFETLLRYVMNFDFPTFDGASKAVTINVIVAALKMAVNKSEKITFGLIFRRLIIAFAFGILANTVVEAWIADEASRITCLVMSALFVDDIVKGLCRMGPSVRAASGDFIKSFLKLKK